MGTLFNPPHPQSPQIPPPAAHPATLGSANIALAGQNARAAAAGAEGLGSNDTVRTSPEGLNTPPSTAKSTLLG